MEIKEPDRRVRLARQCLTLISRIAARGACSENPEHVGYVLEELSQVLFERSGSEEQLRQRMLEKSSSASHVYKGGWGQM
jgi:hypothetical protein